jgi:hypothetical protein
MNEHQVRPKNTGPARKVPILNRKLWRKFYPVGQHKEGYTWTLARPAAVIFDRQQLPIADNALNLNCELQKPARHHQ